MFPATLLYYLSQDHAFETTSCSLLHCGSIQVKTVLNYAFGVWSQKFGVSSIFDPPNLNSWDLFPEI
jgi:hypothetical protein